MKCLIILYRYKKAKKRYMKHRKKRLLEIIESNIPTYAAHYRCVFFMTRPGLFRFFFIKGGEYYYEDLTSVNPRTKTSCKEFSKAWYQQSKKEWQHRWIEIKHSIRNRK